MQMLPGHNEIVHALLFSPDGGSLVFAGKDSRGENGTLHLCDPWGEGLELSQADAPVQSLAFSSDGQWLATGSSDGRLAIWDFPQRKAIQSRPTSGYMVTGLSFLPGDETVVLSLGGTARSDDQSPGVRFWDWRKGESRTLPVNVARFIAVRALAALPEKRQLAWVTESREIIVWNSTRADRDSYKLKDSCRAIAFAPDGKTLAAALDWKVVLYDLERKQERQTLAGHHGVVTTLAFSPDGRHLMTGSWDKSVKFWDAASGQEHASFEWPAGRIYTCGFAPDGLRAAVAGDAGTIVIWDVDL